MSFVDPNLPDVRLIEALSANLRQSLACVEPAVANRSCAAYLQIWAKLAVERLGRDEAAALMRGAAADELATGDRVWFRHAKAGELAERFELVWLLAGDDLRGSTPTYRGEGRTFL